MSKKNNRKKAKGLHDHLLRKEAAEIRKRRKMEAEQRKRVVVPATTTKEPAQPATATTSSLPPKEETKDSNEKDVMMEAVQKAGVQFGKRKKKVKNKKKTGKR